MSASSGASTGSAAASCSRGSSRRTSRIRRATSDRRVRIAASSTPWTTTPRADGARSDAGRLQQPLAGGARDPQRRPAPRSGHRRDEGRRRPGTDSRALPFGQITPSRSNMVTLPARARSTLGRITELRCSTWLESYGAFCPSPEGMAAHGGLSQTTFAPVADSVSMTCSYWRTRKRSNCGSPIELNVSEPGSLRSWTSVMLVSTTTAAGSKERSAGVHACTRDPTSLQARATRPEGVDLAGDHDATALGPPVPHLRPLVLRGPAFEPVAERLRLRVADDHDPGQAARGPTLVERGVVEQRLGRLREVLRSAHRRRVRHLGADDLEEIGSGRPQLGHRLAERAERALDRHAEVGSRAAPDHRGTLLRQQVEAGAEHGLDGRRGLGGRAPGERADLLTRPVVGVEHDRVGVGARDQRGPRRRPVGAGPPVRGVDEPAVAAERWCDGELDRRVAANALPQRARPPGRPRPAG